MKREASVYATALPGRPSARPANHRGRCSSSSPALEWAVRRTRGQRTAGSARKHGALVAVRQPYRCWSGSHREVIARFSCRGTVAGRPFGIEVRIMNTALRLRSTHTSEPLQMPSLRVRHKNASRCAGWAKSAPSTAWPNPSVDGTHNGGARLLASATSTAPSCAPHVKR